MPPIIRVENLGKSYTIRHEQPERYTALRDVIAQRARKLFSFPKRLDPGPKPTSETFWALKDVSFEVQAGDRLGIIGRNGAGKSTLLKILSRITEPTTGRVELNGRVASLLEVGTGFHPELTGRENIFLNGAILGMSRAEIRSKFDEIVDFSGVEKFLDTPVKRYSSGMYVRLAFAVAAHLEPEILLVDEVLAVGDAEFQRKCLGKMEEVSEKDGRTLLFVSHNMYALQQICGKVLWLNNGRIIEYGESGTICKSYLNSTIKNQNIIEWSSNSERPGSEIVKLNLAMISDVRNEAKNFYDIIDAIKISINYTVNIPGHVIWSGINIFNSEGINVFDSHSVNLEEYRRPHTPGTYTTSVQIPPNLLNEGKYSVGIALFNHTDHVIHCHERNILSFEVVDRRNYDAQTASGIMVRKIPGVVRPLLRWEISKSASNGI